MSRPIPTGRKMIPTTKNVGNTVPAVKMGCHAGNFCCLNRDSETQILQMMEAGRLFVTVVKGRGLGRNHLPPYRRDFRQPLYLGLTKSLRLYISLPTTSTNSYSKKTITVKE